MITLDELNELKKIRKTNLYYLEKEYIQYIFLNAVSRTQNDFIFKGGTCLRICYGLNRASEDLDFSTQLSIQDIRAVVNECLKDFNLLNISYDLYSEKKFNDNVRFEIRFKGPLFNGNQNSTNTLKIDFNNQKSRNTEAKVIKKLFSDLPIFILKVLSEKEILSEKIRALINRSEPKDLYDLWFLFSKDVEIDKKLIKEKLKEEKSEIKNLVYPEEKEYTISLSNLIDSLPNYDQLRKKVDIKLKEIFP